ncbi:4Fe-4S binding protein [Candidatus Poribacteria bacterium]|nr:4Fe-4S binding protein [Candidatus Poribacteria bacterium]
MKELLTGNEAIARGAIAAGVRFASMYPGTPATEVVETLAKHGEECGIHVQWAVNEKASIEMAAAASFSGLRSLCAMKHVGVNVVAEFLLYINLSGCGAGMVLVWADDPGHHSSQNEQDSRNYAKMAELPMLEPSTPQEAESMTRYAFELSEELQLPVVIRTVTRLSHSRGEVEPGARAESNAGPFFEKDSSVRWSPVGGLVNKHQALHQKSERCRQLFENSEFNTYKGPEQPEILVITSGPCLLYAEEALSLLNLWERAGLLKLGASHPLPFDFISEHVGRARKVLFIEEVDPYLEQNIRAMSPEFQRQVEFYGKLEKNIPVGRYVPACGELNVNLVMDALLKVQGKKEAVPAEVPAGHMDFSDDLPLRMITFCAGCPHRASYFAARKAIKRNGGKGFCIGDIGCYAMRVGPPLFENKLLYAMGSSIGLANGFGLLRKRFQYDEPSLAVIGDSTFFHAALPELVQMVYNDIDGAILILDNGGTAMTGFQPTPSTGRDAFGGPAPALGIEAILQGMGIGHIAVADPTDMGVLSEHIYNALTGTGVNVVIARRDCELMRAYKHRLQGVSLFRVRVDAEKCKGEKCMLCLREFSCPGMMCSSETGAIQINEAVCTRCGDCKQICPFDAIEQEGPLCV